jgi:GrpB-like predicted nucleotidyltransferase (UPF0157 family)
MERADVQEYFGEPMRDPVRLVPYDPGWVERFCHYRRQIRGVLGNEARIEHVGSTSVPGLLAKPVIDIQIAVPDLEDERGYRQALESLGWPLRGRDHQRRFFRPPAGQPRDVHVHVTQAGSDYEFDHLLFRDALCINPELRDSYAKLKQELAHEYDGDRTRYTPAKAPFIAQTLTAARAWAKSTGRRRPGSATGTDDPVPQSAASGMPAATWEQPAEGENANDYLNRIGEVFARFDRQDSGCLSYGVAVVGRRWFAKTATTDAAAASLSNAVRVHSTLTHPAVIGLECVLHVAGAPLLVYPWTGGEVLYHATVPPSVNRRDPASPIARFRALPLAQVRDALATVLDAHAAAEAAGLVAVDLYDGCLMYDFGSGIMRLCDLDEYRVGAFVLEEDRLPGSKRYLAPEQLQRGSLIDNRTTVFTLGRMLRLLLDAGDDEAAWRGSKEELAVIGRATRLDPADRWDTVAALVQAWRQSAPQRRDQSGLD